MVLPVLLAFKIPDSSGDELILKSMTCMIIVVALPLKFSQLQHVQSIRVDLLYRSR
jgi:hypothetical protein